MTGPKIKPQVDKGVPLQTRTYPFYEMEIGDSFYAGDDNDARVRTRVAATRCSADSGMIFTVRKHEGGYRCWRIA